MGFVSNYLKDALLKHYHGGPDYTRPSTTYFALMTTAPTGGGGGAEASGTGYARLGYTNDGTNWTENSQQVANAIKLDWGMIAGTLGVVVGVAEYDDSSGGNLLAYYELSIPRAVSASPFSIDIGGIANNFQECA